MNRRASERHEGDSQRQVMLAIWGTAYGVMGIAGLYAARHAENPWHAWLNLLGLLLTVAGGWCLAWFFGAATIFGLDRIEDTRPIERTILACSTILGCVGLYFALRVV